MLPPSEFVGIMMWHGRICWSRVITNEQSVVWRVRSLVLVLVLVSGGRGEQFPPTSGEAYVAGLSIVTDQIAIRRRIGYCPQVRTVHRQKTADDEPAVTTRRSHSATWAFCGRLVPKAERVDRGGSRVVW